MPELPEVETVKKALLKKVQNKKICDLALRRDWGLIFFKVNNYKNGNYDNKS